MLNTFLKFTNFLDTNLSLETKFVTYRLKILRELNDPN